MLHRLAGQRGQTLIEFAFVAPIIFVFLFVIVDFGIALDRRIVLQHAVADGARRGAVNPDEDLDGNLEVGESIRVAADFDYDYTVAFDEMLGFFGVAIPGSINMTPDAIKRLEA